MALKGTATIELTNADGSKEIIKHDNMITNAVNDLCYSQRGEMAAILKMTNQNDSYAQAMFGGLLLFGETLNDDPDDYEIPTANIIGYASQNAYAGLDTARGSFNASEGGVQADGSYKFVWDFTTSQANGTIESLALCPNVMGEIGASDNATDFTDFNFVKAPTAPFDTYGRMLPSDSVTGGVSNYYLHIAAIVGDIAYAVYRWNIYKETNDLNANITANGGKLYLYKFKLGTEGISLLDRVARARYLGRVDVQLPSEFISALNTGTSKSTVSCFFNHRDNKLIVFPCYFKSELAVNATMPYVDIDLANNMQVTINTFTNTTAGKIPSTGYMFANDYDAAYYFLPIADYIIAVSNENGNYKLNIIDRKDNTKIKKVTFRDGELSLGSYPVFTYIFVNKNTVVLGFKSSSGTDSYSYTYLIDLKSGVAKRTNQQGHNMFNAEGVCDFGHKVVKVSTGAYLTYIPIVNPFILTTKNNLDEPVVKTPTQTMKITYILSEVSEV